MSPKPKSVPPRLGPPPQLSQLSQQLKLQAEEQRRQQKRLQPKMREVLARQAKMLARWANTGLTWKRILMSWMVLLVASKMVLLVLTYQFFSLTALISLQVGRKKNLLLLIFSKNVKKSIVISANCFVLEVRDQDDIAMITLSARRRFPPSLPPAVLSLLFKLLNKAPPPVRQKDPPLLASHPTHPLPLPPSLPSPA